MTLYIYRVRWTYPARKPFIDLNLQIVLVVLGFQVDPDRSDRSALWQIPNRADRSDRSGLVYANFGRQQVQRDLSDFRLNGFEYISLMHKLHAIVELDFLEALQSHFTSIAAILKTVKIAKIMVDFVLSLSLGFGSCYNSCLLFCLCLAS